MFDRLRASRLLSLPRFAAAFGLAFFAVLTDLFVLHLVGVETLADVAAETAIHGTGFYLGFTALALFGDAPDDA